MEYTIRKMRSEDIPAVARLEKDTFTEPWSEQSFASELINPQATIVVCECDGNVVGFADMREICSECYINNVAVAEVFRSNGIGRALMEALHSACSQDAEFITLEVRESNSVAIDMYRKLGYIKVGVRKDFYRQPTENACLMTKPLK